MSMPWLTAKNIQALINYGHDRLQERDIVWLEFLLKRDSDLDEREISDISWLRAVCAGRSRNVA